MSDHRARRAFTIVEIVIVTILIAAVIGLVVWLTGFGRSASARLGAQMSLQQASRKAVVRLLRELEEGIEVLSPRPGMTLAHAVVRDKLSQTRWYYQVAAVDGKSYELRRHLDAPALPAAQRDELLLGSIRRLTFTCRTEAALQVNLLLAEGGEEVALVTTVRLRNIAAAEELY